MKVYQSSSPEETQRVAAAVAARLRPGSVIALHGTLGSGKTTFVKGLAAALGVPDLVTSPSFSLVNEYEGQLRLFHVDLYRLQGPREVELLDLDPILSAGGITVIEWAERGEVLLPDGTFHITVEVQDDLTRSIAIEDEEAQ